MNAPHLLLWLEGPMQAWGVNSKFNRRATEEFPSRSALLGMVCAALGAGGEQRELLAAFAPLPQTVIAYRRMAQGKAVPSELQLKDFHMVGSGYDNKGPWRYLHIPKKSDGKAANGGPKLTYRYYLQDATFAVALAVPDGLRDKLGEAFAAPCWDLSLGRKCCVPTEFIYQGIYDTSEDALERASALAAEKKRMEVFRVLEGVHDDGEILILPDLPIQFGPDKLYAERTITVVAP